MTEREREKMERVREKGGERKHFSSLVHVPRCL